MTFMDCFKSTLYIRLEVDLLLLDLFVETVA